jgi:hypothetical protein
MKTEAAARSLPQAYLKYVEEKRRSDNEGMRLNLNGRLADEAHILPVRVREGYGGKGNEDVSKREFHGLRVIEKSALCARKEGLEDHTLIRQ